MEVQPYVFFEGRCEEAAAFYRKALGAEVTFLMRFRIALRDTTGRAWPPPARATRCCT